MWKNPLDYLFRHGYIKVGDAGRQPTPLLKERVDQLLALVIIKLVDEGTVEKATVPQSVPRCTPTGRSMKLLCEFAEMNVDGRKIDLSEKEGPGMDSINAVEEKLKPEIPIEMFYGKLEEANAQSPTLPLRERLEDFSAAAYVDGESRISSGINSAYQQHPEELPSVSRLSKETYLLARRRERMDSRLDRPPPPPSPLPPTPPQDPEPFMWWPSPQLPPFPHLTRVGKDGIPLVDRIHSLLTTQSDEPTSGNMVVIWGPTGGGKTVLAQTYVQEYGVKGGGGQVFWIHCQGGRILDSFTKLGRFLGDQENHSFLAIVTYVFQRLPKKALVVLDGASPFLGDGEDVEVVALAASQRHLNFIFTTIIEPSGGSRFLHLPARWTSEESCAFIRLTTSWPSSSQVLQALTDALEDDPLAISLAMSAAKEQYSGRLEDYVLGLLEALQKVKRCSRPPGQLLHVEAVLTASYAFINVHAPAAWTVLPALAYLDEGVPVTWLEGHLETKGWSKDIATTLTLLEKFGMITIQKDEVWMCPTLASVIQGILKGQGEEGNLLQDILSNKINTNARILWRPFTLAYLRGDLKDVVSRLEERIVFDPDLLRWSARLNTSLEDSFLLTSIRRRLLWSRVGKGGPLESELTLRPYVNEALLLSQLYFAKEYNQEALGVSERVQWVLDLNFLEESCEKVVVVEDMGLGLRSRMEGVPSRGALHFWHWVLVRITKMEVSHLDFDRKFESVHDLRISYGSYRNETPILSWEDLKIFSNVGRLTLQNVHLRIPTSEGLLSWMRKRRFQALAFINLDVVDEEGNMIPTLSYHTAFPSESDSVTVSCTLGILRTEVVFDLGHLSQRTVELTLASPYSGQVTGGEFALEGVTLQSLADREQWASVVSLASTCPRLRRLETRKEGLRYVGEGMKDFQAWLQLQV